MSAIEPEEPEYDHTFTKEELGLMLYEPDADAHPVKEYHYFKPEWKTADALLPSTNKSKKRGDSALQEHAVDTGKRTEVDLTNGGNKKEEAVYLDLDTDESVHVVEFYAPWCPHCQRFKHEYIDMAREITRRSIGTKVTFHAVSCEMYRAVCVAYGIHGFPVLLGWGMGSRIWKLGTELNPVGGPELTADIIAKKLGLELAHEAKSFYTSEYSDSKDQREHDKRIENAATKASELKTSWHEHPSDINERYHNAALSLAFALKSGVYIKSLDSLDTKRSRALRDFLDLVDWATPQSWHVRSGMVSELRESFHVVLNGRNALVQLVEKHQTKVVEGGLWGDIQKYRGSKRKMRKGLGVDAPNGERPRPEADPEDAFRLNEKWTEACTHSRHAMGFTCGLWDLFHIISIGSSLPLHQLYGFRSGYLTSPHHVAETVRNFISYFFPCDVCRWNFLDMYDACGHGHCKRLVTIMPALIPAGKVRNPTTPVQPERELALWLWEVHNAVNVRLMKEGAERENRIVSEQERMAGKFPTKRMCDQCWSDIKMEKWDKDAVYLFLTEWYWPSSETSGEDFKSLERRNLLPEVIIDSSSTTKSKGVRMILLPAVLITAVFVARSILGRKSAHSYHKSKKFDGGTWARARARTGSHQR